MRKQREGTTSSQSTAEPATIKEFERQLKLNEQVLRFLTTRVSKGGASRRHSGSGRRRAAGSGVEEVG